MITPTTHGGLQIGRDVMPFRTLDVGVDIDDVLHPWGMTAHGLCEAAGLTGGNMYTGWKMWEDYGCTEEQWAEVIARAVHEGGLYDVPPIPGSVEVLRRLTFLGHRVHLVTARGFMTNGDKIKQHTLDWISEFAVPHASLTFSKDKPEVARRLELDFFIDDAVHNFQALELEAPQTTTYLLSAPHNLDFWTPFRLESMEEFGEIVIAYGNQGGQS